MSYISAYSVRDDVIVWVRDENGDRVRKKFPAPYYFYTEKSDGPYRSIYGVPLSKWTFETKKEMDDCIAQYKRAGKKTYESDLPPALKVLSREYYNKPAPKLNVTYFDIEVDYDPKIGYSTILNPYAPINSVAFHHAWKNETVVLAVPPDGQAAPDMKQFLKDLDNAAELDREEALRIEFCENERELLMLLLLEIADSDIISGWNSDFFDVPYIAERLQLIGDNYFKKLDFHGAPKIRPRDVEVMGRINRTYDLSGRVHCDYLALFRKYEMAERHSYKLETIAEEFCPDLPKLDYEGSLATLYRKDFAYFVRYNIRDTEILKGLESKVGYVGVANTMCHISTGLFKHVTGTIKLADLATVNYCHHELGGLVVNDLVVPEEDGQIQGAFVLIPQVGEHENIGSVDITSLYPKSIIAVNISPETLIGQFAAKEDAVEKIYAQTEDLLLLRYDDGREETRSAKDWHEVLYERKHAISGYGTVFNQETKGIIPTILDDWFATRKKYQKMAFEAKTAGQSQDATYYDKLQYIYKIKLNSFYGALTNKYFRFYDLRMGESTTGTGRNVLLHQCAMVCKLLEGEYSLPDIKRIEEDKDGKVSTHYGYSDKWSVVYGDTDSTYFATHAENDAQATMVADKIGDLINKSFPDFMTKKFRCHEGYRDNIQTGREIVSDKGIFVDKKRYILHIINDDGFEVDKMKVMGLDTKKTTLPKAVSKKLNGFIERYLKGESWNEIAVDMVLYKEALEDTDDITEIGLPKGVNKLEQYTHDLSLDPKTRLPGHVAASVFYNRMLEKYDDKESMGLTSGMKIRVFYLKMPIGRFKSIALPVDMPGVPEWFDDFPIDRNKAIERLVDNPIQNIIKAIDKHVPSAHSLFADEMVVF